MLLRDLGDGPVYVGSDVHKDSLDIPKAQTVALTAPTGFMGFRCAAARETLHSMHTTCPCAACASAAECKRTLKTASHASSRGALALIALRAMPALAANERSMQFGDDTGSGMTRQDQSPAATMNAGQTLSVNRGDMNFVRSTGTDKVDATLQAASPSTPELLIKAC